MNLTYEETETLKGMDGLSLKELYKIAFEKAAIQRGEIDKIIDSYLK